MRKAEAGLSFLGLVCPDIYLILQLAELDSDSSHTVSSQFDSRLRIESQTPVLFNDL